MFGFGNQVEKLKRKARSYYKTYLAEFDTMDCGRDMGMQMNSRFRDAVNGFNRTMDELAKLDPNCPATRL